MSGNGDFAELRSALDEAITYGENGRARRLATRGLRLARTKELLGELEYFKGQVSILDGDFAGAIDHFDRAVSFNPYDGASYNDRALCMVELGAASEAFLYFDKGIEVEPDYATIHHNKGWLLNKLGRHREAIRSFREALALDPDRAVTYENIGNAFLRLEDLPSALAAYRKALELLPPGHAYIRRQLMRQIESLRRESAHD